MEAHAQAVTQLVKQLLEKGEPGNSHVALAAAVLHDIGIPEAIARYGNAAPPGQETEGARFAQKILIALQWPPDKIRQICDIVRHHHQRLQEPLPEFRLVFDADLIVNAEESGNNFEDICSRLYTLAAKEIARERLGNDA